MIQEIKHSDGDLNFKYQLFVMKKMIPIKLRDTFRPAKQKSERTIKYLLRQIKETKVWPRSKYLYELRNYIKDVEDIKIKYSIAKKYFGLWQKKNEIIPFLNHICSHAPRIVGEIGMFQGGNTFLFTQVLHSMTMLVGVDLKLQNIDKIRFFSRPNSHLKFFEGCSYSTAIIDKVKRHVSKQAFDLLFIDGDHSYEGGMADLLSYYPLVKQGGLIAFHDIVPDEVARGLKLQKESQWYGGEIYLIWKVLKNYFEHREFVESWDQYGFGIGVIQKPDDRSSIDECAIALRYRNS